MKRRRKNNTRRMLKGQGPLPARIWVPEGATSDVGKVLNPKTSRGERCKVAFLKKTFRK